MTPQLDLYGNISEIRDVLDTLLKRGKPASVADLEHLLRAVQAQATPVFDSAEVARQLGPSLVQAVPTPATVQAAGATAAHELVQAVRMATTESQQELGKVVEQLRQQAAQLPREVRLQDQGRGLAFTSTRSGWRFLAGVLVVVVVFTWALVGRGELHQELTASHAQVAALEAQLQLFQEGRARLLKEQPQAAYRYFPTQNELTPDVAPPKKAQKGG